MSGWYYARTVNDNQEAVGPYDSDAINSMLQAGILPLDTMLFHQTHAPHWVRAGSFLQPNPVPQHGLSAPPPVAYEETLPTVVVEKRIVESRRSHSGEVRHRIHLGTFILLAIVIAVCVVVVGVAVYEYRSVRDEQRLEKHVDKLAGAFQTIASGGIDSELRAEAIRSAEEYLRRLGFDELSHETTVRQVRDLIEISGHASKGGEIQEILLGYHVTNWNNRQVWRLKFSQIDQEVIFMDSDLDTFLD